KVKAVHPGRADLHKTHPRRTPRQQAGWLKRERSIVCVSDRGGFHGGWDSPVEIDRERLERLFPPELRVPGVGLNACRLRTAGEGAFRAARTEGNWPGLRVTRPGPVRHRRDPAQPVPRARSTSDSWNRRTSASPTLLRTRRLPGADRSRPWTCGRESFGRSTPITPGGRSPAWRPRASRPPRTGAAVRRVPGGGR